ncbi:MAG: M28 family peptidase [Acidobacteria bacterium]|nr:M28 family peptidase [Acidobacteriota bacterium]MBI3427284.1 M28 family peptidase [Acidobacteriota bacterium]
MALLIRNPQSAIRISLLLAICLLSLACAKDGVASKPMPTPNATATPEPEQAKKTTDFSGERAFNHVKTQVEFGPRPAGSAALEKTREYLVKELKSYGLKVTLDEFTPTTPQGKVKMKNIIAELPGEAPNIIAIASHYDTKPYKEFAFVGANDGGSSTGALLEIARVMAAEKTKRKFTYQFVFFDGEEAFCADWSECLNGKDHTYGSSHMVERLRAAKQLEQIKALILLDMIGDKDLKIPREQNSSSWLMQAIWETAQEAGYNKNFPARTTYTEDDHARFLEAGVSAVDLIDFEYGGPDNPYWHTKEDTLDKISAQSLKAVGDVVLLSLPKIEAQIR